MAGQAAFDIFGLAALYASAASAALMTVVYWVSGRRRTDLAMTG